MTAVPFSLPYLGMEEQQALAKALEQPVVHGNGPTGRRVQQRLSEWLDVEHVLLTSSCTHALEMAMLVLGIGPEDEVIMPSFNFVSSANAVVLRGGQPVFADIRPETMNLDPKDVVRKITPRTRAIVPVHYAGIACEMDALMELAADHDLAVVEDAAQGVGSTYRGQPLGTIGHIGCFSFHGSKNITCGEGGAFLTDDETLARRAEIIREKGTNRASFMRGQVDKYSWHSPGSSFVLSDLLAAVLETQLTKRKEIQAGRRKVWEAYTRALEPLARASKIKLPAIPEDCQHNHHIFFFHVPTPELRPHVLDALSEAGIEATFHYVPLHTSPFGRTLHPSDDDLPNTEHYSHTLIRLPIYPQLAEDIEAISRRVAEVVDKTVHLAIAA